MNRFVGSSSNGCTTPGDSSAFPNTVRDRRGGVRDGSRVRARRRRRQMTDIREARKALVSRILDGRGHASPNQRRAAFDNAGLPEPMSRVVEKVARHAYKVTDDDIAAVRMAGFTEDQIFELVVCAAIGQATRQYEAALAAVEAAPGGTGHAPRDPR